MNQNLAWGRCIVEALLRTNKATFFSSPGARNSPLLAALNQFQDAECHEHFDERGLGFLALGHAKATGNLSVLICTSGSAPAHFLPAVMEAFHSDLSLFVLSADRPPELTWNSSNQATDQLKIYGGFVHRFVGLPTPSEDVPAKNLRQTIHWLSEECLLKGPVHVNVPFREPLLSAKPIRFERPAKAREEFLRPTLQYPKNDLQPLFLGRLANAEQGLVLLGKTERPHNHPDAVVGLVRRLRFPVLADVGSFARTILPKELLLEGFSYWLHKVRLQPKVVLQLGGSFVHKGVYDYLNRVGPDVFVVVSETSRNVDPANALTHRIRMSVDSFALGGVAGDLAIDSVAKSPARKRAWLDEWKGFERCYRKVASTFRAASGNRRLNELQVADCFVGCLGGETLAFVGNSSPIRDVDGFGWAKKGPLGFFANRGLSGIDGLVATASGVAIAHKKPVWVLMGDLSFLHDLSSLLLFEKTPKGSVLVVINNHEGSLFRGLSIFGHFGQSPSKLLHPHGKTFDRLAAFSNLSYHSVCSEAGLRKALDSMHDEGLLTRSLVEVFVEPRQNHRVRLSFQKSIERAFERAFDRKPHHKT